MDPDTIGHICLLFNESVSCEYLFSTDIPLPRDYNLAAKKCYSTKIEYTGGGVHDAFVYKKVNYKSTSTDEHTYDEKLRNISSCLVDSEEDIKQQISNMDDSICRNHSSRYPSLRFSSIAHNNTRDSPATQIEGLEVVTLSPGKSNDEYCSRSEQEISPDEEKMSVAVSPLSDKRTDDISFIPSSLPPEKMSEAVSPLSDKRTLGFETVPARKKFKITSTRTSHAYNALDIFFASNPIEYGSLSESWNILATSLMQGKWLIVY